MHDVVGVGTNSVDRVFSIDGEVSALVMRGKLQATSRSRFCGGQTATAISACAALGLRSSYVGAFGSDENGRLAREALNERGVDSSDAIEVDAPNREAVILVDRSGNRAVVWHLAAAVRLDAERARTSIQNARVVHVDDDDARLAIDVSRIARAGGRPVTSDIEHLTDRTEELIRSVTFPILEGHLPREVTGEADPERALRKLRRLNANVLCMTLGEHGAAALEGDRFHVSPAFSVNAVDTTGCGDVFRAGFIYGVLQGWAVPETLKFANAAAAISCTRPGAIPSVPSLREVHELLSSTQGHGGTGS